VVHEPIKPYGARSGHATWCAHRAHHVERYHFWMCITTQLRRKTFKFMKNHWFLWFFGPSASGKNLGFRFSVRTDAQAARAIHPARWETPPTSMPAHHRHANVDRCVVVRWLPCRNSHYPRGRLNGPQIHGFYVLVGAGWVFGAFSRAITINCDFCSVIAGIYEESTHS
jgi:hypothetical protein